jgi:O-antigen/teichoic acid export membrane protein
MANEYRFRGEAEGRSVHRWMRASPLKQRLVKNTGWILFDRLFRLLLGVTVGAWVARHLGPVGYGQLSYVLSLLILFQSVCMLGLDGPVVREVAHDRSQTGIVLGSAFSLSIDREIFRLSG